MHTRCVRIALICGAHAAQRKGTAFLGGYRFRDHTPCRASSTFRAESRPRFSSFCTMLRAVCAAFTRSCASEQHLLAVVARPSTEKVNLCFGGGFATLSYRSLVNKENVDSEKRKKNKFFGRSNSIFFQTFHIVFIIRYVV